MKSPSFRQPSKPLKSLAKFSKKLNSPSPATKAQVQKLSSSPGDRGDQSRTSLRSSQRKHEASTAAAPVVAAAPVDTTAAVDATVETAKTEVESQISDLVNRVTPVLWCLRLFISDCLILSMVLIVGFENFG